MICNSCGSREFIGYRSSSYPYDSGYKCCECRQEYSDLQVSREQGITVKEENND